MSTEIPMSASQPSSPEPRAFLWWRAATRLVAIAVSVAGLGPIPPACGQTLAWAARWNRGLVDGTVGGGVLVADAAERVYVGGAAYYLQDAVESDGFVIRFDPDGGRRWFAQYDMRREDGLNEVLVDRHGNVFLGGVSRDDNGLPSVAKLVKYDSAGRRLWVEVIPIRSFDQLYFGLDEHGNVRVVALDASRGGALWVFLYTPSGELVWARQYRRHLPEALCGVAFDRRGHSFVAAGRKTDLVLIELNAGGHLVRESVAPGVLTSFGRLRLDASGAAYWAGWVSRSGTFETALIKFDASPAPAWQRRFACGIVSFDVAAGGQSAVALACAAGSSLLARLDPDGRTTWQRHGETALERPSGVRFGPNGSIAVCGGVWEEVEPGEVAPWRGFARVYSADGALVWSASRDRGGSNYELVTHASGEVSVLGATAGYAPSLLVLRYDRAGRLLWRRSEGRASATQDRATALAIDPRGGVFVAGTTDVACGVDGVLLRYGPEGTLERVTVHDAGGTHERVSGLAVDGGGNAFVASNNPSSLAMIGAGGRVRWRSDLMDRFVSGVDVLPGGRPVVSGNQCESLYVCSIDTLVYDRSGAVARTSRHDDGWAVSQAVDPVGNVFVTGNFESVGADGSILTVAYDASGRKAWARLLDSPKRPWESERGLDVAASASGEVGVAGYSGYSGYRLITAIYSADGTERWVRVGPFFGASEPTAPLAFGPDGRLMVAILADEPDTGGYRLTTIAYAATGEELWAARVPGEPCEHVAGIAVDQAGDTYVAATCAGDFRLLRYGANGEEVWDVAYDGGGPDEVAGLAIDALGTVYLTGTTRSSDSGRDIVTVAYR